MFALNGLHQILLGGSCQGHNEGLMVLILWWWNNSAV